MLNRRSHAQSRPHHDYCHHHHHHDLHNNVEGCFFRFAVAYYSWPSIADAGRLQRHRGGACATVGANVPVGVQDACAAGCRGLHLCSIADWRHGNKRCIPLRPRRWLRPRLWIPRFGRGCRRQLGYRCARAPWNCSWTVSCACRQPAPHARAVGGRPRGASPRIACYRRQRSWGPGAFGRH